MLGEIEHLQSVLADIIKQTISPSTLPLAGEDLVRDFRLSDHHNYDDQVSEKQSNETLQYVTQTSAPWLAYQGETGNEKNAILNQ